MKTFTEKQQTGLLKKFHTLLNKAGLGTDEKQVILSQYGVESSRDLSVTELVEICERLDINATLEQTENDRWRKRVIAAIGGWLRMLSKNENAHVIKGIACRATGHRNFNDIPVDRLRNIYYAFQKKQRDFRAVEMLTDEELTLISYLN
jgi:GH18 family chitinase